jgi:CubicO group peptidase (beta-lactamase class C family)
MRSPARFVGGWFGGWCCLAAIAGAGPLAGQAGLPVEVTRRIDTVFARFAHPGSPGCALGVYRDGRMVYARGYGSAQLELGVPITPATVFDLGSTSKQFTAMSILLLARDGKLSLDDDVRRFLPELPAYGRPITIRHLLHHTSGLRDYLTLMALAGESFDNVSTDEDALDLIVRQRALDFTPGSEWEYSNTGFFLLSLIVKRASGQSLREFAAARIFGPLGMTHTQFRDDHRSLVPNRAAAYDPPDSTGAYHIDVSNFEQTGDGAVHSTVEDLLVWDRNFYSGQVGGPEVLAEMVQPGTLNDGTVLDYASGLMVGSYRGLQTVSHGGSWGGYRAELLRFPAERVSMACLCNVARSNPTGLARRVADVVLADRLAPAKAAAPDGATTDAARAITPASPELLGAYRDPASGTVARVGLDSGRVQLEYSGDTMVLTPVGAGVYSAVGSQARVRFEPASGRTPRRIQISGPGLGRHTLEAIPQFTPPEGALARYAGEYASLELGVGYRIAVESDALALHAPHLPADRLRPTIRDEFESPALGITLRFSRGAGGRVTGFTVATGRTQGLRFDRARATSSPARPRGR